MAKRAVACTRRKRAPPRKKRTCGPRSRRGGVPPHSAGRQGTQYRVAAAPGRVRKRRAPWRVRKRHALGARAAAPGGFDSMGALAEALTSTSDSEDSDAMVTDDHLPMGRGADVASAGTPAARERPPEGTRTAPEDAQRAGVVSAGTPAAWTCPPEGTRTAPEDAQRAGDLLDRVAATAGRAGVLTLGNTARLRRAANLLGTPAVWDRMRAYERAHEEDDDDGDVGKLVADLRAVVAASQRPTTRTMPTRGGGTPTRKRRRMSASPSRSASASPSRSASAPPRLTRRRGRTAPVAAALLSMLDVHGRVCPGWWGRS